MVRFQTTRIFHSNPFHSFGATVNIWKHTTSALSGKWDWIAALWFSVRYEWKLHWGNEWNNQSMVFFTLNFKQSNYSEWIAERDFKCISIWNAAHAFYFDRMWEITENICFVHCRSWNTRTITTMVLITFKIPTALSRLFRSLCGGIFIYNQQSIIDASMQYRENINVYIQ